MVASRIRKDGDEGKLFHSGRRPYGSQKEDKAVTEDKRISKLEERVAFLAAQMEFVKQVMSVMARARRERSS